MRRYFSLLLTVGILLSAVPAAAAGEDLSRRVTVSRIRFLEKETEIYDSKPNAVISAECQVERTAEGSGKQEVFLILQTLKNGKLVDLKKARATVVPSGGAVTLRVTAAPLGQETEGYEVSAFVTADMNRLIPLSPPACLGSGECRLKSVRLNGTKVPVTGGVSEYDCDLTDSSLPIQVEAEPYDMASRISVSRQEDSVTVRVQSPDGTKENSYLFRTELLKWEDRSSVYRTVGTEWPFRPEKDYQSQQNPPDFSWPYIAEAVGYDLKICKDREMSQPAYQADKLKKNYYNFEIPFETGTYYWSVRYRTENGVSAWTEASRFTVLPDASEYTVEPIDTMLSRIPKSHPRIAVGKTNLQEYRRLPGGQGYADETAERVRNFMKEPMPEEPVTTENLRTRIAPMTNRVYCSAISYLLGQDPKIGAYGVEALLSLAAWDPEGITSYVNQDQAFRDIMLAMVQGYDYLYDILTPEQRQTVLSAIRTRAVTLEHPTAGLSDAAYKLKESPYMSHGGTGRDYILLASIALYGELPEAEQWLREYLPMYLNMIPVWGNQDGGWAQGTGYATTSYTMGEDLRFTLYTHGIANVYNKAFYKNIDKFGLYFAGKYGGAEFGDGSTGIFTPDWALIFKTQAYLLQSPYAAWLRTNCGYGASGTYANYYMHSFPWPGEKSPEELPKAEVFPDIGWTAMHSSMTDYDNRISAYFKSSPFGAYNHSHPDQNSFVIQAYGERLAIDSGYYDYYHSPFDLGYTRKTYAHNAVTMDGGIGQAPNIMVSKGEITGFVHHPSFDLASGDAAEAYNYDLNYNTGIPTRVNRMETANRHLIYLKPDTFLVIDDLKRTGKEASSFEWWLNALAIDSYTNQAAFIQQGKAAMDTVIHYPPNMTAHYSDTFSGPDGASYTPSGEYANQPVHQRVWFSTPKVNSAKIIATMSVHPSGTEAAAPSSVQIGNALKLSFADGTAAYVKTDSAEQMTAEGIETDAQAIVVKDGNYLMADGTFLAVHGNPLFRADKPVSAAYGSGRLSISCREDAAITIRMVQGVTAVTTQEGKKIPRSDNRRGIQWDTGAAGFTAKLLKGFYTLSIQESE